VHLLFHFLVQMIFGVSHIQQWTLFPLYERVVTPCPQMLFISLNGFQWNFERFFINWWHCASPVSYFDANDFWGFLYHTIDLAMSVIIFNSISYLFLSIFIQQRDYWVLLMVWVCRHCHCCFLSIDTMFFVVVFCGSCNKCLSPLQVWIWISLMVRCTQYNIIW
jgi:hypothetical protein